MSMLRRHRFDVLRCGVGGLLLLAALGSHAASPFFAGTTADLWVVDAEGRITGYNFDAWLDSYLDGGSPRVAPGPGGFVFVNQLPGGSSPLAPGQPVVSFAGLGEGLASGEPPAILDVDPAGGSYEGTLAVRILVSEERLLTGAVRLSWQLGAEAPEVRNLSASNLTVDTVQNGFYVERLYVVQDGEVDLTVTLETATGSPLANTTRRYTITAGADGFRRDSDGDGLPDLLEAELGLDPFDGDDWRTDLDGDGWSEFDEWLRLLCLDTSLQPTATGSCVDADGLPLDTDLDGWSDFDEQLRRTNPADPEPNLTPTEGEALESLSFRERVLRYKDHPAASWLYGSERLLGGVLSASGTDASWAEVQAATLAGALVYDTRALLQTGELDAAQLGADAIADRLQWTFAQARLAGDAFPDIRIPASESVVLAAGLESENSTRLDKVWFQALPDHTPLTFQESGAAASWTTLDEWRADFIAYLAANLVRTETAAVDATSTGAVAVLEAALAEESRLAGGPPVLLGGDLLPPPENLAAELTAELSQRFALSYSLDAAYDRVRTALAVGQPLEALGNWIDDVRGATPAAIRSDLNLLRSFQRSFDAECFLSDAARADLAADAAAQAAFDARCPISYTEPELLALLEADAERRYQARLLLLPGAAAALVLDGTLTSGAADSDGDTLDNVAELAIPLFRATLPWLPDSDGDSLADAIDECGTDPLNACAVQPVLPLLFVDADATVAEPASGEAFALVGVQLSRASEDPVTIGYEAVAGAGAEAGSDFGNVIGEITLQPGERIGLIRIPVFADAENEADESFQLVLTGLTNARLGDDGLALVTVNDTPPTRLPPDAVLLAELQFAGVGEPVTLDASLSTDPQEETLSFFWVQTDATGIAISISNATAAVAGIEVPLVAEPTVFTFEVTVTNESGLSDSAVAAVQVTPDDQPPVVSGPLFLTAVSPAPQPVPAADILAQVTDPEGGELTLVSAQVSAGGTVELTADGIVVTPPADPALITINEGALERWVPMAFDGALIAEGEGSGLVADQVSAGSISGGYSGTVVQTFTPEADDLAGLDVYLSGTAAFFSDVRLKVWAGPLRSGAPLVDVAVSDAPARSVVEFRFPPVSVNPGETYYLELFQNNLTWGAIIPGAYGGGAVIEGGGNLFGGGADVQFVTYTSNTVPRQLVRILADGQLQRLPVLPLTGRQLEALVASPFEELAYAVLGGDGANDVLQIDLDTVRTALVTGDNRRSVVDPRTGDLYSCDAGSWRRIDRLDLTTSATGIPCEDSSNLMATIVGTSTCLAQETLLACTNAAGTLEAVDAYPGGQIMGFSPIGFRGEQGALMFVANADAATNLEYHTYVLKPFAAPVLQLVWSEGERYLPPTLPYQGGVLIFYTIGSSTRPFLYSEPGGVPQIAATPIPAVATVPGVSGGVGRRDGTIIRQRQDMSNELLIGRILESVNPQTGAVTELARTSTPFNAGVPFDLYSDFEFEDLYLQGEGSRSGVCTLQRLEDVDNSLTTVVADIRCASPVQRDFSFYVEQGGFDGEALRLVNFSLTGGIGDVTVFVTVEDPAGNRVVVPVILFLAYSDGGL